MLGPEKASPDAPEVLSPDSQEFAARIGARVKQEEQQRMERVASRHAVQEEAQAALARFQQVSNFSGASNFSHQYCAPGPSCGECGDEPGGGGQRRKRASD